MLFNLSKVGRRAFTLVELIIVIVIVGILAAISIVGYQSVVDRSEQAAAETTLQSVDREYRALAAFNMAADPSAGVSIADMTVIDGIDYTAGDTDSDGLLEPGETVTFDGVVLTLSAATTTGDLSTSAADDGSSESADPYAGWDSYVGSDGVTRYFTAERTGLYTFSFSGVFAGGPAPSDPVEASTFADIHIGIPTADGSVYDWEDAVAEAGGLAPAVSLWHGVKQPQQSAINLPGLVEQLVLYENAQGHAEWSFDADMTTQWAALSEAEAAAEKVWRANEFWFDYNGEYDFWDFEMSSVSDGEYIPAWNG